MKARAARSPAAAVCAPNNGRPRGFLAVQLADATLLQRLLDLDDGYGWVSGDHVPYGEPQLQLLFGGLYHCA
jgi:hypothetical protein